jgi:hypothetical protein
LQRLPWPNAQCCLSLLPLNTAVPLPEHLPTTTVTTGGQSYVAYSTYSGSGTRYLWRWEGSFDNGLIAASLRDAEMNCSLLGGHLPSLHSQAQAEHLLGVHNSLWPRNSGWSLSSKMWLGFFAHMAADGCSYTEETSGWGPDSMYGSGSMAGMLNMLLDDPATARAVAVVMAKKFPRAWSDWSLPDYPGMLQWRPSCEGRALNITRDTDAFRGISTLGVYRGSWDRRPYVCACEWAILGSFNHYRCSKRFCTKQASTVFADSVLPSWWCCSSLLLASARKRLTQN